MLLAFRCLLECNEPHLNVIRYELDIRNGGVEVSGPPQYPAHVKTFSARYRMVVRSRTRGRRKV
jgi:hypothetical protein